MTCSQILWLGSEPNDRQMTREFISNHGRTNEMHNRNAQITVYTSTAICCFLHFSLQAESAATTTRRKKSGKSACSKFYEYCSIELVPFCKHNRIRETIHQACWSFMTHMQSNRAKKRKSWNRWNVYALLIIYTANAKHIWCNGFIFNRSVNISLIIVLSCKCNRGKRWVRVYTYV